MVIVPDECSGRSLMHPSLTLRPNREWVGEEGVMEDVHTDKIDKVLLGQGIPFL